MSQLGQAQESHQLTLLELNQEKINREKIAKDSITLRVRIAKLEKFIEEEKVAQGNWKEEKKNLELFIEEKSREVVSLNHLLDQSREELRRISASSPTTESLQHQLQQTLSALEQEKIKKENIVRESIKLRQKIVELQGKWLLMLFGWFINVVFKRPKN